MKIPVPLDRVLFAAGTLLALLDPRVPVHRLRWTALHSAMAVFVLWTVWSALTQGTLFDQVELYALLDRIVVPFSLFALAPVFFNTPERRAFLLKALACVGLYLGTIGVFQVIGPHALVLPKYVLDPTLGIHSDRARGPLLDAAGYGMSTTLCAFAAGILYPPSTSGLWRLICAGAVTFGALGILLSLTRAVWMGAAFGVVLVCVMVPGMRKRVVAFVLVGCAVAALALASQASLRDSLVARVTTERSLDDRANTNDAALRIVDAEPLTGIGWGQFSIRNVDWVRQADTYPVTNVRIEVHNVPLSRAAELGVPAAALWVAIVLMGPVRASLRRPRANAEDSDLPLFRVAAVAMLPVWALVSLLTPNPFPQPNNIYWAVAGVLSGQFLLHRRADAAGETNET